MAFQYGAWQAPQAATLDSLYQGVKFGSDLGNDQQARQSLAALVDSQYGRGTTQQPQGLADLAGGGTMVDQSVQNAYAAQDPNLAAMLPGYLNSIKQAESGGNPNAKNPNSSATGLYQFTGGTWEDVRRQAPQLGLTPDGRTDPAQQERAAAWLTAQNAKQLARAGIQVNPGSLYSAHFLGAGGATQALGLPDETPMAAAVSPEVIQANPHLANMTVGQFKQWSAEQGGNGRGGYQPPIAQQGQPQAAGMGGQAIPPRDVLKALVTNPQTREIGLSLIEQARNAGQGGDPVKGVEINGRLVNPYTGELIGDFSSGGAAGAGRLSTQPQYAIDPATGKIVLGQIGADGSFHRTEMGGLQPYDPVSMAGAKQGAVVDAKTAAAAREALPAAQTAADIALKAIDTLRNDAAGQADQFGRFLGIVPQQWTPALPGTEKADFRVNLEQAGGQAFMQARQMLKGGGQITDFEGRRAEAAYSRMQAAAANGSQQEFQAALDDFEWAVRAGVDKLKEAAAPGGAAVQPGWQDAGDGVRIRVKE